MADIVFENVSLAYGKTQALDNISFTIKENTICGLLGRNGAGKTSLMSLIASYRNATSGTISYDGKPIFDNAEVMPEIAFIRHQSDDENGAKVKELLRLWAKFRPRWDEEYAHKLLKETKIPLNKPMSSLSLGMQATVRGILGLASRCPVTLYDEAYLGMDAAVRTWFVQEILEDYLREPRTILFSTHFIGEVENMLEDVLVLSNGHVLIHEDRDSLRSKGVRITGDTKAVDEVVAVYGKPLSERSLGGLKEVVLFVDSSEQLKSHANQLGLELSLPSLQDLFVHITEKDAFNQGESVSRRKG